MSTTRSTLSRWASEGLLPPERMREALMAAGVTRTAEAWRVFLERLLLWAGVVALAAALGFFIAANWQAMGRFGKLALVEGAIVVMVAIALWRGIDSASGRASLFGATLGVGTLLALVGQTYQTGADNYELFVAWGAASFAWVAVSRQPALWVLWIAIIDLAVCLYATTSTGGRLPVTGMRGAVWAVFAIHVAALVAWETLARRGAEWMRVRWAPRLLAIGALAAITAVAVEAIVDESVQHSVVVAAALGYAGALAGAYAGYRVRSLDRLILACCVLSVIAIAIALTVRWNWINVSFGFFAIGVLIVSLAAAGAQWLRGMRAPANAA